MQPTRTQTKKHRKAKARRRGRVVQTALPREDFNAPRDWSRWVDSAARSMRYAHKAAGL